MIKHNKNNSKFFLYFIVILGYMFFLFYPNLSNASGYIDTLEIELNKRIENKIEDDSTLRIINRLIVLYSKTDLRKSLDYSVKAERLAKGLNSRHQLSDTYQGTANIYLEQGLYDFALNYYLKALVILENLKDSSGLGWCNLNIGNVYYKQGSYEISYKYYLKSKKIFKKVNDYKGISVVYNNLGLYYIKKENYDNALNYFNKSLEIRRYNIKDNFLIAHSYNYLGEIYKLKKDYEKSFEYFDKSVAIYKLLCIIDDLPNMDSYWQGLAESYANVSSVYLEKEEYLKSIEMYWEAIEIYKKIDYQIDVSALLLDISKVYTLQRKYRDAIEYATQSLEIANERELLFQKENAYLLLSEVYSKLGYHEKSLEYYKNYDKIKDFLINEDITKSITKVEVFTETQNNIKQNEILQLKIQHEKKLKNKILLIYALLFVFIAIIAIIQFRKYVTNKKINQLLNIKNKEIIIKNRLTETLNNELIVANKTKDKFFSIISHDLRTPFNAIIGFSDILFNNYDEFEEEEKKEFIKNIRDTSESTYGLLDNLLNWTKLQLDEIVVKQEKVDLHKIVNGNINLLKQSSQGKSIALKSTISEYTIIYADANILNTVFRNLLSNALKFTDKMGEIVISAIDKEKFVEVSIADTGIGISEEDMKKMFVFGENVNKLGTNKEKGSGFGLLLCKEFIEKNKGKIWVESELGKGTKFHFTIPKPPVE